MSGILRRKLTFIDWRESAKWITLDQKEYDELRKSLDPSLRIEENYTKWSCMRTIGTWHIRQRGMVQYLYTRDSEGLKVYKTNIYDDHKNNGSGQGTKAIQTVAKMFLDKYGVKLTKAFGTCPLDVKLICSPKQLYYTNERLMNKKLNSVSSVDFSSHYPSNTAGKLPDYNTAVRMPGTVKPTEEYPFAIYVKSGHLAEYSVFDTHEWVNHQLYFNLFSFKDIYKMIRGKKTLVQYGHKPTLNPDEDETILMKASQYELGWLYEELYERRNEDEKYKLAMNASLGRMAFGDYRDYKLAHIRAFVIARANNKMLNLVDKIGIRNIIQLCVDGIQYIGSKVVGEDVKALGVLHQEQTGVQGKFRAMNQYILKDGDDIVKVKHGGFNACDDETDIDNPEDIDDVDKWIRILRSFEEELENERKKD